MDIREGFKLIKNQSSSRAVVLSSDGSWHLSGSDSSSSYVSRPTSRAMDIAEMYLKRQMNRKAFKARVISPMVFDKPVVENLSVDEMSTAEQSIDEMSTEEQSIDEKSTEEQFTDEKASTVDVFSTCDVQRVSSLSTVLMTFEELYGKDVYGEMQSSISSGEAYKRLVDVAVQVDIVNFHQAHANPVGDAENQTPIGFQRGTVRDARNRNFQGGDMKWRIQEANIDTENRGFVAKKKTKKTRTTNKQIKNIYMSQANKVSMKPAPFPHRASSYINRQAKQKETDRNNYILSRKLMNVKATVSSFR